MNALVLSTLAVSHAGYAQQPTLDQRPAVPAFPASDIQVYPGAPTLGVPVYQQPATPVAPGAPAAQVAPPNSGVPGPAGGQLTPGAPGAPVPTPQHTVTAPAKPAVAEMSFVVGANVNPDRTGRPSPVIVRTYELKSATRFNSADFFAIYQRDKEILGPDLIASDEWALAPGNNRQALKNLQRDTRYVGVIAAFRDMERAQWRAATFVYPNQTTRMEIRLERNEVKINLQ